MIHTTVDITKMTIPVFKQYGVRNAILFGSYGKGTATEESDVDLLVDSGLKGLSFIGMVEDLRDALGGKDVDVMDVTHIEKGSPVDMEIQKTGVLIYAG